MPFKQIFILMFAFLIIGGCAKIPGKSGQEQINVLEELHDQTLNDLFHESPEAKEQIKRAAGYAIMNNSILKIPLVGAGSGYGIAVDTGSNERTYIKMIRFDFGAGWGARDVRPVLIIYDQKLFKRFISGKWIFDAGAEAAVKAGEHGGAGGAGASGLDPNRAYDLHMLTDTGVSATATAAVIHVRPISIHSEEQR